MPTPSTAQETNVATEEQALEALRSKLDLDRLPRHMAIIMDGNGRWAKQKGWRERIRGHEAGAEAVRTATRTAAELHIEALTLYAFSKENWARPRAEIEALMLLLRKFLVNEIPEMNDNGVRLIATGELDDLPGPVRAQLDKTMEITSGNDGLVLNLALSYGGRAEIVHAARALAREVAAGTLKPDEIDEAAFERRLYRPELPPLDLLVRTSGEMRVSNFLLWQIAYTEIHVTRTLWPDFRKAHFYEALLDYQGRDRRFGKVK